MSVPKSEKFRASQIPPLLHPPLVEAIFEVRWELKADSETRRLRDPAYPMMYGRLYERMKKEFPVIEDLPSVNVHPEASPFVVRHRMRKEKNGYPLLQIGPGIAAVNAAKGYGWKTLSSWALKLVGAIEELFPTGSIPLNFIKGELSYLNGFPFDVQKENPLSFFREKLHTNIEIAPEIFSLPAVNASPHAVNFQTAYPLSRPTGNLVLSASLGHVNEKPAYLVQTVIESLGEMVPSSYSGFEPWLEEAHEVAEHCFASLCKGALLEKFCTK